MSHASMGARRGRLWTILAVVLLGGAGCAPQRPVTTPAPQSSPAASVRLADTVWYISARAREAGRDTRRFADSLAYGLAIHTYRRAADVLEDGLDIAVADSVMLTRSEFVRGIRDATGRDATDDFAVLFVHGYGTSQRECWRYAAEARIRSRSPVPWVAFCWPSNGAGFERPTRNAILDRAYRSDSAVAVESQPALVRATEVMLDALPASRLMLVSHSLGAQLLVGALSDSTALRARLAREATRAIVFAAPDLDRDRFADSVVANLQPLTERLVLYVSGHDRMLALSRVRSGTPRAGERRDGPLRRGALETVDATEGLSAENRFAELFGTHHALRRASGILFDMIYVVGARRPPECREAFGTGTWSAEAGWVLTPIRPDRVTVGTTCAAATSIDRRVPR
ncbi:alpha/beta hydrolase [Gemmatimonas groenlandica]|uniref:Alpha/beta hydrolase n=1 Tax=Gemmatimonas groenlandica TaxID=2732249 RepID=A0A6M4IJA9_9BACT|nr:alpha/beta hydrolase [Gemmatimonas groenlandica]QJR34710.1 alpha/beta hydrolase [Gemmatimonas groenlandica]